MKITISTTRMHIDFWNKFFINNIKKEYVYFVSLIDETIKWTMIRFIAFKTEIHNFLIHEIRHLLIEDKKLIMCIRIDNALKYKVIEKKLRDMNVYIKFIITYIAYQNEISKRFNRIMITIIKTMLVQSKLSLFFWIKAIIYACHIYNKLFIKESKLFEKQWIKIMLNLSNERVFKCVYKMFLFKKQRRSKLHSVNYLKIYIKYYSKTQYRVYKSDKNQFEWFTNVIFYEYRKGLKLLFENLFSKFDFMRVEKAFMLFDDDDIINDVVEAINKYIFNDDDDQKNDKTSINNITSSSTNEQNNDLKELILKRDFHQATFNHHKKDS